MNRVLMLLDTAGNGGAETVFVELAAGLLQRGHTVFPLLPGDGWVADALRMRGIEPRFFEPGGSFDVRHVARLASIIRRERIDIVHAHLLTSIVYGSVAATLCGVPVVGTIHGVPDLGPKRSALAVKCWLINRLAASVVFVSSSLRDEVVSHTPLRPRRVDIIYNGIDAAAYSVGAEGARTSVREEFGVTPEETLIASVGNIRPAKAYDVLLRTARRVLDAGVRVRFIVAGQPREPLSGQLRALSAELGLDATVHFVGFREDVARILSAADIFLLTSNTEGFSLATVQAMAAGAPVVATRSGGPEEILEHGRTGLLVATDDPDAAAQAVLTLVSNRDLAQSVRREASVAVSRRFTSDAMIDKHMRLFGELLGAPESPR